MRERGGGAIVHISSVQAMNCQTRVAAYAASKGGLVLLTRSMAKDHARDGLRANAICPGGVDTPMLASDAEESGVDVDEFLEEVADAVPSGRIATPEDIAALALFLASDAAAHVNGTAIPIDGAGSA